MPNCYVSRQVLLLLIVLAFFWLELAQRTEHRNEEGFLGKKADVVPVPINTEIQGTTSYTAHPFALVFQRVK